jgi:hypothetical protein
MDTLVIIKLELRIKKPTFEFRVYVAVQGFATWVNEHYELVA